MFGSILLSAPPTFSFCSALVGSKVALERRGGSTEDEGRGSAQRTPEQWWLVFAVGAENKNFGFPVGALVGVGKNRGRNLN